MIDSVGSEDGIDRDLCGVVGVILGVIGGVKYMCLVCWGGV